MTFDPIDAAARVAVLALNNAHAQELSWLDTKRLDHLVGQAFYARQVNEADAFLIAFEQSADYDSPNFHWFRDRFERFVYIDRIAVAIAARGRGLAKALYHDLFEAARIAGHDRVVCEVNADPPNAASDAFHAALGFAEIGAAAIHGGKKRVRYFERRLFPS